MRCNPTQIGAHSDKMMNESKINSVNGHKTTTRNGNKRETKRKGDHRLLNNKNSVKPTINRTRTRQKKRKKNKTTTEETTSRFSTICYSITEVLV